MIGPNLGATAAGRNLGRFADLLGEQALAGLGEIDSAERAHRPDARWAELVYLPAHFRSANVAIRPHPRPYEIAVGTTPGVGPGRVIPPGELVVGIRAGRFYVRWPRHDAEVIGCAGHMLNNMAAPDVVRFLDDVHRDRLAQLSGFDWGPASALPVLPRVQAGRIVLSLARWRLGRRAAQELARGGPGEFPDGWLPGGSGGRSPATPTSGSPTTGCCSIWRTRRRPTNCAWNWPKRKSRTRW